MRLHWFTRFALWITGDSYPVYALKHDRDQFKKLIADGDAAIERLHEKLKQYESGAPDAE